jgi:hypothetical protein
MRSRSIASIVVTAGITLIRSPLITPGVRSAVSLLARGSGRAVTQHRGKFGDGLLVLRGRGSRHVPLSTRVVTKARSSRPCGIERVDDVIEPCLVELLALHPTRGLPVHPTSRGCRREPAMSCRLRLHGWGALGRRTVPTAAGRSSDRAIEQGALP